MIKIGPHISIVNRIFEEYSFIFRNTSHLKGHRKEISSIKKIVKG